MNERPDSLQETLRWVEKAEHDLAAAQCVMPVAKQGLTDIICFHCQQCAEKYLKALLVWRGVPFPKTHDLRLLWGLLPAGTSLGLSLEQVVPLNRYVIEGRYPGNWEPITLDEARLALTMAQAVRGAVLRQLPGQIGEQC